MAILEPVFKALNENAVRYVVVGGLAVVLHGHARLTVDVDLIVDLEFDHARRAIGALTGLGLRPRVPVEPEDFADPGKRAEWIRQRGMQVFSLVDPNNPMRVVDLFVEHPLPFQELWERANEVELRETSIRVASIPDLIELKKRAGRPQDEADVEALEAILQRRGGTDDE
jgi:hypothetical protein